ncbi:2,4-dihydroxyhept-2-ene-1,7-dioic acid aldolase [Rhodobacteraceae bacterium R_SAG2]|nr:2,4-dihydroxyhept-2-ene-1,7-dioic acid aldolase [Rhodobacteraceae bacterium R_SAG2]
MSIPSVREKWEQGIKCINGWCAMPSTITAEIVARQPFDTLTIDLQHGLVDYQTALTMLQAMGVSKVPKLARVRWNDPGFIMALLDAGFTGIICPMINTRAEAEAFVSACHYAPRGSRSFGPTRAAIAYGADYQKQSNTRIATLAMIETREALANLDDILTVEGLDAVYIGPSDLAISMGYPPSLENIAPDIEEAIRTIREKAHAAGRFAGIHTGNATVAAAKLAEGFDLASLSTDTKIFSAAVADMLQKARPEAGDKMVKALY